MNFLNNRYLYLHRISTIILFLGLLFSCSTNQKSIIVKPEWSLNRPKTDFYYIGIAKVDKAVYPNNYRATAKKMALNDLASEISIKIESNSLLSSYENNNGFNSDYQQYIKTEIHKELSGFEMVDEYEDKKVYQVYYRLSKSKWDAIQAQQKANAAKNAFHWYKQAYSEKNKLNYTLAIQYDLNALVALKKYWNESILYRENQKTFRLDSLIKNHLLNILSDMTIMVNPTKLLLNTSNHFSQDIGISVLNKQGQNICNIPLTAKYKKKTRPYQVSFLSQKENYKISISDINFNKLHEKFVVNIDKNKILKIATKDRSTLQFIYDAFNVAPVQLAINVEMPRIFINSKSKDTLKNHYSHYLQDGIRTILTQHNIKLTENSNTSDLSLTISIHESKNPDNQRFKQVYLSYSILVRNTQTQNIVYSQDFPQIKGTDNSFEKAQEKVYTKAVEDFKYQFAKKFIMGILK